MNLINATAVKILSPVYLQYGRYWVKVECESYGRVSENTLMFDSEESAKSVTIGYECLI